MSSVQVVMKWLAISLLLFVFYEILWMLLNSASGDTDIIPTKLECVIDLLTCTVQITPCLYLIWIGSRKFSLLSIRPFFVPILLSILFVINLCVAIPFTFIELNVYEYIRKIGWTLSEHILNDMILAIVSTLLQTIYLLRRCIIELKDLNIKSIEAQKEVAESRLIALQSQIDPHFLFNCLSTCVGLIDIDSTKAKTFIQNLAYVYRHILQNKEHYFVSIQDELTNLEHYTSLIDTRFGKMIQVNIDQRLQNDNHTFILRGVLQLLVENAIKHNKKSIKNPLHVIIYANDEFYIVENTYRPLTNDHSFTRIGQENIRKRYETLGFNQVTFAVVNNKYIVHIPILHHEDIDNRR